jgi:pimeloyl-ACP methyl ester carboxylesterase
MAGLSAKGRVESGVRHRFLLSAIHPAYPSPRSRFTVTTTDDIQIRGVTLGASVDPVTGPTDPLVIFCHGLLSSKNHVPVQRFVTELSGFFDVMVFDFRGHGRSGGVTSMDAGEVEDLRSVVTHAKSLGYRKVIGIGASMGGAIAIRYQAEHPDLSGVATIGAFAAVEDMRRPISRLSLKLLDSSAAARAAARLVTGTRVGGGRHMSDPIDAVRDLGVPLLLVHGGWDPLVAPLNARLLYDQAAEPKTIVVLPRRGHVSSLLAGDTLRIIEKWIAQHFQDAVAGCQLSGLHNGLLEP